MDKILPRFFCRSRSLFQQLALIRKKYTPSAYYIPTVDDDVLNKIGCSVMKQSTYGTDTRPRQIDDHEVRLGASIQTSEVWAAMGAYRFEDSRGGDRVERHLSGYAGLLQVDGWGAYNRLADARRAGRPLTLAACWAHLRRKFYELHVSGVSHVASETVARMAKLWAVDAKIRGQDSDCLRSARQATNGPIVAKVFVYALPAMKIILANSE